MHQKQVIQKKWQEQLQMRITKKLRKQSLLPPLRPVIETSAAFYLVNTCIYYLYKL